MTLDVRQRLELVEQVVEGDVRKLGTERLLARDAYNSLAAFCQQFFWVNDPGTELEWAWFHTVICKELEWVTSEFEAGRRARLVICIPPGCMKSMIVSVLWPCWWWLRAPERRFLTLANKDDLAKRDSNRMRNVLGTDWYQRIVEHLHEMGIGKEWNLSKHQRAVTNFVNSAMGGRQTFSMTAGITGFRGDVRVVDDPHQVADVMGTPEQIAAALNKAHRYCDVVLPSRCNDMRKAAEVVVQQRVHEDDVGGRRLRSDKPHQRKVVFAVHFDPDDPYNHPDDPRTEKGELLDPVRMPEDILAEDMATMEAEYPGQASAQYNQRPQPAQGGMFKKKWTTKRYDFDFQRPPVPWDEVAITVDATYKRSKKADYVSIQAWGRRGWEFYLGDEIHEKMGLPELIDATRDFIMMHRPRFILVEAKANGQGLIDTITGNVPCIVIPFIPDKWGDKVSRAASVTMFWRAMTVWLPDASRAPWIGDYVKEVCGFPAALNDDRVDAMSQLLMTWQQASVTANHDAQASAIEAIARMIQGEPVETVNTPQMPKGHAERRRERAKALASGR